MKNVIASFAIFVIMLGIMIFSIVSLDKMCNNLEKSSYTLEGYVDVDSWSKAESETNSFSKNWDRYSKKITLFVNHQELDNIENELEKLKAYVKTNNKDEALASINVIKFYISHISKMERINIQNIF